MQSQCGYDEQSNGNHDQSNRNLALDISGGGAFCSRQVEE
jgi:hypothetical protein